MHTKVLEVIDVSVKINKASIIDGINFEVFRGEVLCVLGPNGAGKTTLLKAISGQLKYEGQISWQNRAINTLSTKRLAQHIAVVSQLNDVVFSVSLYHVVRMGLLPHKTLLSRTTELDEYRIENAIEAVGLRNKMHQEFSKLSGGEQQRALIARALVQRSPLLLLDEPVNHLDIYYQHQIMQLICDLAQKLNVTVIMSLHDLNLAARYSDKLGLMSRGQMIAFGQPKDVLRADLLKSTFNLPCSIEAINESPNVVFLPEYNPLLDLGGWY